MIVRDVVGRAIVSKRVVFAGGCGGRGTGSRTTFYPCRGGSSPRTPNAVCVRERSRQPVVKQTHLIFGSASADHQDTTRSLQPAVTIPSILFAATGPFSFAPLR